MLWIRPVQKALYRNNMKIIVQTKDLGIAYPTSVNTLNNNDFIVKFYSWENRTEASLGLAPLSNDVHASLKISNFPSSTITYTENPSGYAISTFDYLRYPHERYFKETPYNEYTHRAPF